MKKNTTISERFLQMIDYLKVSKNDFAKKIGYNRSQAVYDVINGKSKPSFDFFEKFYNSEYSETFNTDWIIKGEGNMLKEIEKLKELTENLDHTEKKLLEFQIKGLETENKLLLKSTELYKELNNELKFRIATLEKEIQDKSNTGNIVANVVG